MFRVLILFRYISIMYKYNPILLISLSLQCLYIFLQSLQARAAYCWELGNSVRGKEHTLKAWFPPEYL